MPIQSTSEGKISLAKGIIFTKIGLANGYILKLWAAPPNPKFSREPPVVTTLRKLRIMDLTLKDECRYQKILISKFAFD